MEDGKGAYLKERIVHKDKSRYSYVFTSSITSAGKKLFDMGLIRPEKEMTYKIPSGKITLNVKIIYTPEVREYITRHLEDKYEILVINIDPLVLDNMTIAESKSKNTSGLRGITINAMEGVTYQINCRIEDGKAYIWIEDTNGNKASREVLGIGWRSGHYWLWETLPEPSH